MELRSPAPRGLVSRSMLATLLFLGAVVPGWVLGDLIQGWTGWGLLDWLVTFVWSAVAVVLMAPYTSYRRRDAWQGLVPLWGWYLACVLAWRTALLPYRDWEPRADELWRARWLTGDLVGLWRADPLPGPPVRRAREKAAERVRAGSGRPGGRATR